MVQASGGGDYWGEYGKCNSGSGTDYIRKCMNIDRMSAQVLGEAGCSWSLERPRDLSWTEYETDRLGQECTAGPLGGVGTHIIKTRYVVNKYVLLMSPRSEMLANI